MKQCAAVTPAPLYSSLVPSVKTLFATVLDTWEQGVPMQSKMLFSKLRDRKGFQLSKETLRKVHKKWGLFDSERVAEHLHVCRR